jgi:hypothetical protein
MYSPVLPIILIPKPQAITYAVFYYRYSPCIINDVLGKAKIRNLEGWTSWGGKETHHKGDTLSRSIVLCILPKIP